MGDPGSVLPPSAPTPTTPTASSASDVAAATGSTGSAPAPLGAGTEIAQTLSSLNDVDYSSLVLARRLSSLQSKDPTITASLAADVASGLNDTVSNTTDLSPDLPSYAQPNALSVLVNNALSNSASLGAVNDLSAYQQNLQALGYLPQDYAATGQVDQQFANASYQYTSDIASQIQQGKGRFLSTTTGDALSLLATTLPSGIWKTVVGTAHGLAQSFGNTVKDIWIGAKNVPGLVTGSETGHDINQQILKATGRTFSMGALGEDVANVLTIAAMAVGVGELGAVVQGVSGLGEVAADQGLSAIIRPVAGEPGLLTRSLGAVVDRFGPEGAGNAVTDFFSQYGPKAIARSPLMEVVGKGYGALRWMTLPEGALSVFEPHSVIGKAVRETKAPWWVDLPVMTGTVEPGEGITKTAQRLLTPARAVDFSSLLPESILGLPKELRWTNGQRTFMSVGAYVDAIVHDAAGDWQKFADVGVRNSDAWSAARQAGGLTQSQHISDETAKVIQRVVTDYANPDARAIDPAFAQEAVQWANKNPAAVAAHYLSLVNSASVREANGLMGMGEWDAFDQAARVTNEASRMLSPDMVQQGQSALFEKAPQTPATAPPGTGAAGFKEDARVLAARADTPTQGDLASLADQYDNVLNGYKAPDGSVVVPPNPAMQVYFENEISKLPGMIDVAKDQWLPQLRKAAANAPQDVTEFLTQAQQDILERTGYKAVLGGSGVLLPSDLGDLLMEAPKMSKAEYALTSLGLSPTPVDGARLVITTQMARANEAVADLDPGRWGYGTGERMLQDVYRSYDQMMGERGKIIGEGSTRATRMVDRLAKTVRATQGPSLAFIRDVLEDPEGKWALSQTESGMVSRALFAGMKDGAAAPGLVDRPQGMLGVLHTLAAGMRVTGLPGIMDALRSFSLDDLPVVGRLLPENYGFLFDTPLRLMTALRFQLNPMFELRKLAKGEMIAFETEGLAPSLMPWKAMQRDDPMGRLGAMDEPPAGYTVHAGQPLIDRYSQIFTRTQGQDVQAVTDVDKAFRDAGVLGYNLQHHAIYDVGRIWDRTYTAALDAGKTSQDATTVADAYAAAHGSSLYTFGGKSPLSRSANFLFFPLSFEAKATAAATNYLTAAPVRLFIVNELARRLQALDAAPPGQQSKFQEIVTKYAPLFKQVASLNPWRNGVGLSSVELLGLYKPLADTLGLGAEDVANALHPGIIHSGDLPAFKSLLPTVLPGYSAISTFFKQLNQQASVITAPSHESNAAQINDYYTLRDGLDSQFGSLGLSFGTDGSMQAFLQSSRVPTIFKVQYQTALVQIQTAYPAGALAAAVATNASAVHQVDIDNILNKVTKSVPEQAVTQIEATKLEAKNLGVVGQKIPLMRHILTDLEAQQVRAEAVRLFDAMSRPNQTEFNNLWIKLGYASTYGPIAIPLEGGADIGSPA